MTDSMESPHIRKSIPFYTRALEVRHQYLYKGPYSIF